MYHRRYGAVEVLGARVIKADGTEVPVTPDLITDGTPPEISAMDIYETDFRQKTVVFPNLEVGDAVETLVVTDSKPLLEDEYSGFFVLQLFDPVKTSRVTVLGPSSKPLKYVVKGAEATFRESTEGATTQYQWTATDLPRIEREPGMVSPAQIVGRVIVSTVHTWPELSRIGWRLTKDKCVADETVKSLVAEITKGLTTTEDKMRAIHYWILDHIRYLGVAMDRGAFLEPHMPSYTIEKEYGVCRDKAVLETTMFAEIGVPAWTVFINVNRETDTEVPTVNFEHGIIAVKGPDGEYRYIDPTIETSRDVYANYPSDRWVLLITEEGDDLRRVPHLPASQNSGVIGDACALGDDLSIAGSVTVTGRGMYEEILRTIAKAAKEEQLRMMWEESVHGIHPAAVLSSFSMTDPEDLADPLAIRAEYTIADYALDASPYLLFRVPAATGVFDFLSQAVLGGLTGLAERKHAVGIGTTLGIEESSSVTVPRGWTVESLPDAVSFAQGAIGLSIAYEFAPATAASPPAVRYQRTLSIDSHEISPADYLALKEAVRLASRSTSGEVILRKES
jgi:transglutaminase-like putative cysteine protease